MKRFKEKFENDNFVRPLYKKVRPKNAVTIHVDSIYKLDGHDFEIKRNITDHFNKNKTRNKHDNDQINLPGTCDRINNNSNRGVTKLEDNGLKNFKMLRNASSENTDVKVDQEIQVKNVFVPPNVPDTWLRVYPLPKLPNESICSVVIRCIVCQLGLATFLIIWTVIWVFIIQSFEGPNETILSLEFQKEQNQLVIDLATELRQITPVSPKWRAAIETRIEDERQLTIHAIGNGARMRPGHFWDLPGTFLFTIYVMTALGFGAPVPHTIWGKASALIYAFLAVPMHIYLMVNSSTCIVRHVNKLDCFLTKEEKKLNMDEGNPRVNKKESANCSRNSEFKNSKSIRRKCLNIMCVLCACRCVPLAAILYYACGAIVYGVLRSKPAIDVIMFPLEFTTTGGLESVEGYVRILYGFYIEGAMILIACTLATLRRHSSDTVNTLALTYRLFIVEP